jgi:hypothetical protein
MTRDHYDQRRRQLDAELRAGIDLLESAHRLQVHALDLAWTMLSQEPLPPAAPAASPASPAEKAPPKRRPNNLLEDLDAALARLPEAFDRNDICRELGYQPERSMLFRALQDLVAEGNIAILQGGEGRTPTRYRRLQL